VASSAGIHSGEAPSIGHALRATTAHGGLEPWAAIGIILLLLAAGWVMYERRRA
jgi:hypothetical protein